MRISDWSSDVCSSDLIPYVTPLGQPPISTMVVEPVAMMLAACDADGDAGVTRDEARACLARSFASIDTTGAGSLGYIAYSDWAERFLGDPNALPSPFETDEIGRAHV